MAQSRLLSGCLVVLALLLCSASDAHAQGGTTPTPTYTPIPTRTPSAATQAVITVMVASSPLQINRSVSYGDVYVVMALAALGAGLGLAWAHSWVKGHIKVSQ
jgi:hypothetical protein